MAKYIVDLPDAYTSESALFGDILSIPICLEGGKRYGIPTGIKLEPYTEPDREAIEDEVWEFARKVEYMDIREREEAFNIHYPFNQMSYKEAKYKYEVWKRTKEEICVGDEIEAETGKKACVLYENPDGTQLFVFKANGTFAWWSKCKIHKTGKKYSEIAELLKKMRESNED